MTSSDLTALLPLVIIAGTAIAVMLVTAFRRSQGVAAFLCLAGMAVSFAFLWDADAHAPRIVTNLLLIDRYSLVFLGLILSASFAVALLIYSYLKRLQSENDEFYVLLLLATLGTMVMAASIHFVSFFLGLELLSVSLYVMVGYVRLHERSLEAAVKYLILAAASSAFLLFGMALIYADAGTMQFQKLAASLGKSFGSTDIFLLAGLALMTVGIGFKLAVVPFHLWTPDVYEGAPAPVTAYIATVSKGAMVALLVRFALMINIYNHQSILIAFSLIAIASMFVGNLLALLQTNVKRILAYSSIAHLGYMLVALIAGGGLAVEAIIFYLVAYFVTTLAAFGIVSVVSNDAGELDAIDDYRGLFWTRPWLGASFTGVLLSLAGIPLTAGFIGKYFIVAAGVGSAQWLLVVVLVINSAIGLYYYLRIVVAMLSPVPDPRIDYGRMAVGGGIVLSILAVAIVLLGVYPSPILHIIRSAVTGFMS